MAKQKKGGAKLKAVSDEPVRYELGDLRGVEPLLEDWLKTGSGDDAVSDLQMLGRDAAGIVARFAEEHGHAEMKEYAKKLVAMPAQVKTNMLALRAESVSALVAEARSSAPNATDLRDLEVQGPAVAVFDPERIAESLAKGGKPRRDVERVRAGDVVWFGVEGQSALEVTISTQSAPEGQPVARVRLVVSSGVVYVGRPEAADGPRLGELRLDPFRTSLHDHLDAGRLARLKPGVYLAAAYRVEPNQVRVHITPDPAAEGPPPAADLGMLIALPVRA